MNTEQSELQALIWTKSSYSGGAGGECVEVAPSPRVVHIRDSKNTARKALAVSRGAWSTFVDGTSDR